MKPDSDSTIDAALQRIRSSSSLPLPAELSQRIRAECTHDLRAARGASLALRLSLSIVLALSAMFTLNWLQRGDGLVWVAVLLLVLFVGIGQPPGRRMTFSVRAGMAVGVPLALLSFLTLGASHRLPLATFVSDGMQNALSCFGHALLVSSVTIIGMALLWRRTDPLSPRLTAALIGLAGGLGGAISVNVSCSLQEAWHLWLGHGFIAALTCSLCGLAGRRIL